jgi:hypothetical protein
MNHGVLAGALDLDLDVATFEFELGNVFLDEELDQFFQLFLIHSFTVGCLSLWRLNAQTSRAQILPG